MSGFFSVTVPLPLPVSGVGDKSYNLHFVQNYFSSVSLADSVGIIQCYILPTFYYYCSAAAQQRISVKQKTEPGCCFKTHLHKLHELEVNDV